MLINQIEAKSAFIKLRDEKNAVLVDVRCEAEVAFVGYVEIAEKNKVIYLPWKIFPQMTINPNFITSLQKILNDKFGEQHQEAELIFICRSGARSSEAAICMAQLGYKHCFNLIAGFEGDIDEMGHRGNISGWKFNNLPWRQS